jgi:hypothetical protein
MGLVASVTDPHIRRHLLREEGEVIVDEVRHHWVVYVIPVLEALLACCLLIVFPFLDLDLAWVPLLLGAGILAHAGWHGVLSQQLATMPLSRILDITVRKPLHGRMLGFGHFCFESAAQEQGLRDIRYVGRPDERDLAIQRVVQRSGLRTPRA